MIVTQQIFPGLTKISGQQKWQLQGVQQNRHCTPQRLASCSTLYAYPKRAFLRCSNFDPPTCIWVNSVFKRAKKLNFVTHILYSPQVPHN